MRKAFGKITPQARKEGLVVQELPEEVLVYDLSTNKAHCLNRTAAFVWKHCDGRTSVSEVARLLQNESESPVDRDMVLLALNRLSKENLLQDRLSRDEEEGVSRRDVLRKVGWAAAASLPLVTSIVAPTAASAATAGCIPADDCGPDTCNQPCHTTGSRDCTKVCRPRGDKKLNCSDPRNWQCVGTPAGPCDC